MNVELSAITEHVAAKNVAVDKYSPTSGATKIGKDLVARRVAHLNDETEQLRHLS